AANQVLLNGKRVGNENTTEPGVGNNGQIYTDARGNWLEYTGSGTVTPSPPLARPASLSETPSAQLSPDVSAFGEFDGTGPSTSGSSSGTGGTSISGTASGTSNT